MSIVQAAFLKLYACPARKLCNLEPSIGLQRNASPEGSLAAHLGKCFLILKLTYNSPMSMGCKENCSKNKCQKSGACQSVALVGEPLGISRHHFLCLVPLLNDGPGAMPAYRKKPKQGGKTSCSHPVI